MSATWSQLLIFKKIHDRDVGINSLNQQTSILPLLITRLWLSVLCAYTSTQNRWWLISLVPLSLNGKPTEREGGLGWLPMARGKKLMLSDVLLFNLLNKQSLWHISFLMNAYRHSIFIWHNGPICFLLTCTSVSLYSSNHRKPTGCFMCSFH